MIREKNPTPEYAEYISRLIFKLLPNLNAEVVPASYTVTDRTGTTMSTSMSDYLSDLMDLAILEYKHGKGSKVSRNRFLHETEAFASAYPAKTMVFSAAVITEYYLTTGRVEKSLSELQYTLSLISDFEADRDKIRVQKRNTVLGYVLTALEADNTQLAVQIILEYQGLMKGTLTNEDSLDVIMKLLEMGQPFPEIMSLVEPLITGTEYAQFYQKKLIMSKVMQDQVELDEVEKLVETLTEPIAKAELYFLVAKKARDCGNTNIKEKALYEIQILAEGCGELAEQVTIYGNLISALWSDDKEAALHMLITVLERIQKASVGELLPAYQVLFATLTARDPVSSEPITEHVLKIVYDHAVEELPVNQHDTAEELFVAALYPINQAPAWEVLQRLFFATETPTSTREKILSFRAEYLLFTAMVESDIAQKKFDVANDIIDEMEDIQLSMLAFVQKYSELQPQVADLKDPDTLRGQLIEAMSGSGSIQIETQYKKIRIVPQKVKTLTQLAGIQ